MKKKKSGALCEVLPFLICYLLPQSHPEAALQLLTAYTRGHPLPINIKGAALPSEY